MNTKRQSSFMVIIFLALFQGSCSLPPAHTPPSLAERKELTILYTNDEHGWLEGVQPGQGAANLMGLWRSLEGYSDNSPYLILSGGDNWTGPAISSWFDGESTVEVMNAMGYTASVIGNHEFDFGLDNLKNRLARASFPYLSANIRTKKDGKVPSELGIQAFTMITVNGLKVGLVGLTTNSTPYTTHPANIADFNFIDYEQALREAVPQLRAAGADLILAPTHICMPELTALALKIHDLNISFLGGGHCNESLAILLGNTIVASGGYHFTGYAYARFVYDPLRKTIVDSQYGVRPNQDGQADENILAIVAKWKILAQQELDDVIGFLDRDIPRQSQAMQDLITESWLFAYPQADIALTNLGGMRDRLPAGDITLADLIGVMPFNNVLVEVRLNGRQILDMLRIGIAKPAIGGMHLENGHWVLNKSDETLLPEKMYSVLVNDFMYAGGDQYELLSHFDPHAYNTGIDWRQPVIDWILLQESSPQNPLDRAIAQLGD